MTAIGWIQILLFCAIIVALVKPLGGYMTRVFNGERTFLSPILRPVEVALYWIGGVDEKREQHWLTYTVAHAVLSRRRLSHPLWADAAAGLTAVQPGGAIRRRRGPLVQHRDQLHHQHQLAELRRRKHDVLPRADARPHASELPVGGNRHRARGRADPRLCARLDAHRRQFLGRYHALHALHPAADLRRLRAVPGLAGHAADARPYVDATTLEGAKQTIAVGPVASQVAIKMLGTNGGGFFNANAAHPFENPTALSNFVQMHLDLRDRRRADQRVRPHGRQPAAGLGRFSP